MTVHTKVPKTQIVQLDVPALRLGVLRVNIIGDSPLIVNRFSKKAQDQIAAKQSKAPKEKKAARDPQQEYEDSFHRINGKEYGFPALGFKSAMVTACGQIDGVTKTLARGAFHVVPDAGDLVKIVGTPHMRTDHVHLSGPGRTTSLCYRGEFPSWTAKLTVRYNMSVITPAQLIHLINTAGFAVGIGEWRPERDGNFGMFHATNEAQGDDA